MLSHCTYAVAVAFAFYLPGQLNKGLNKNFCTFFTAKNQLAAIEKNLLYLKKLKRSFGFFFFELRHFIKNKIAGTLAYKAFERFSFFSMQHQLQKKQNGLQIFFVLIQVMISWKTHSHFPQTF